MINKIKGSLNLSVDSLISSNFTKIFLLLLATSCTDNVKGYRNECETAFNTYQNCLWSVLESREQNMTLEDSGVQDMTLEDSGVQDITSEDFGAQDLSLRDFGLQDMSLENPEGEYDSETSQICLKELARVRSQCVGLEIPDVGIPNFGLDASVSNDQGVYDAGGMMNSVDQGEDVLDMGELMNSIDQGAPVEDQMPPVEDQMPPVEDQMSPVEDQAVEVDAMLPENSVEDFDDPDLVSVNNSYPSCFVDFPRQERSLSSIFQRFFNGLNDGSIQFLDVCPAQFSNIDVEYSAVMPELRGEIIANGCYVFTGFNLITPHVHLHQVFTESHFLEDVVTHNVYEIRNRNDRYWIKVYSTTGTTTNITHCGE